jgi:HlyD family secretion protein
MPTTKLPAPAALAAPPAKKAGAPPPPPPRRRRRSERRLAWLAAAALLALLLAWTMRPAPLEVETAAVARGPLRETVREDGVTRVREHHVVAAPIAGRLLRVELEEGDAVAAGDVVARIASAPLDPRAIEQAGAHVAAATAAAREAAAVVQQQRAGLDQARRDAARLRTLARAGAVAEHDAELTETDAEARARGLAAAGARLAAAEAEVRAARAGLADADPAAVAGATVTLVRAPVGGRVLRVAQESESAVAAGTPLLELGDAEALEVVVDVLSSDAVGIRPGMPMVVEEWGGPGALEGRVRTVSPGAFTKLSALGVEEQRVNVVGDLLGTAAGLGAGYRVEARIVTWEGSSVLKVPSSALLRRGGGWAVFVLDGGRIRLREVALGHRGETEAEVLGGVGEGERVVLYPSDRIADGVRGRSR